MLRYVTDMTLLYVTLTLRYFNVTLQHVTLRYVVMLIILRVQSLPILIRKYIMGKNSHNM